MSDSIIVNETSGPGDCKVTGTQVGNKRPLDVYLRGGSVNQQGKWEIAGVEYDWFELACPTAIQEVWTFYDGGQGGTLVATATLNFTDTTKCKILNGGVVTP